MSLYNVIFFIIIFNTCYLESATPNSEQQINTSFWSRPLKKDKQIPVFEDKFNSNDVELLTHSAVANFTEMVSNSKILFDFMQDLNNFILKVKSDLTQDHLFLSGLINLHFLSKFEAEIRAQFSNQNNMHFISGELKKLFKIAKNKIGTAPIGSDLEQYKFYLDELDQQRFIFYNAIEDLKIFLKHIKNELSASGCQKIKGSNELTIPGCYKDGLKDLFLILEHPIIEIDPIARADVMKIIQVAYKRGEQFFSNNPIFPNRSYLIEIINKALDLESNDCSGNKIFKEESLRLELMNLQNKIYSDQPQITIVRTKELEQQVEEHSKPKVAYNKLAKTTLSSKTLVERTTQQPTANNHDNGITKKIIQTITEKSIPPFRDNHREAMPTLKTKPSPKEKTTPIPAKPKKDHVKNVNESTTAPKLTNDNKQKISPQETTQAAPIRITTDTFNQAKENVLKNQIMNRKKETGVHDKTQKKYSNKKYLQDLEV